MPKKKSEQQLAAEKLLEATKNKDAEYVANSLNGVHRRLGSIMRFSEQSNAVKAVYLAAVVNNAYSFAVYAKYDIVQVGRFDERTYFILFIPYDRTSEKTLAFGLISNNTATGERALGLIKQRVTENRFAGYISPENDILFVGVAYNTTAGAYDCAIDDKLS